VSTLSAETGRPITVAEVRPALERHLADALGFRTWRYADGPEALAWAAGASFGGLNGEARVGTRVGAAR
jgi:hypothetical protein